MTSCSTLGRLSVLWRANPPLSRIPRLQVSIIQSAKHLATAIPILARRASPRPENAQLVVPLTDKTVAGFRHLVPCPGEVDKRFRDNDPCLVGHLLQALAFRVHIPHRAHLGAVVQRTRLTLARVPERPHALPIGRRNRHLKGVFHTVSVTCLLHQTHHALDCARRVVFEAERNREKEQQLRICRPLDGGIQRLVYGEYELTFNAREVAHEAIVDPEPSPIAERVAIGLLDGRPRRGADVRQKERRLDVAGDFAQIAVVPSRLDTPEDGRRGGVRIVPADPEAVPVGGLDAEAGVETLVDQGVLGLVEQLLEEDRGARVSEPAAHRLLLSFRRSTSCAPITHGSSTRICISPVTSPRTDLIGHPHTGLHGASRPFLVLLLQHLLCYCHSLLFYECTVQQGRGEEKSHSWPRWVAWRCAGRWR